MIETITVIIQPRPGEKHPQTFQGLMVGETTKGVYVALDKQMMTTKQWFPWQSKMVHCIRGSRNVQA